MNPLMLAADETKRAPDRRFRAREFARVISLLKPYRRTLIFGLFITIGFAGLHTVGIAAVFPVFQVLLEDEGLHGWANRTLAGERLGVSFAPLESGGHGIGLAADAARTDALKAGEADVATPTVTRTARFLKVKKDSPLLKDGVRSFDILNAPGDEPVAALLQRLAYASAGESFDLNISTAQGSKAIAVSPQPLSTGYELFRSAVSYMPPDRPDTKVRTLAMILAAVVIIVLTANFLRFTGETLVAKAVLLAMMDLRDLLYERILRLPMTFFAGTPTADLVTRFGQDIQEVQRGLTTLFGKAMREPVRAAFLVALALVINWRVTITLVVVLPVAVGIFFAVGRKSKKANLKLLQAQGAMIGALTASLQNLRVVKAYTAEDHERRLLDEVDRRMLNQQLRLARLDAFLSPMLESIGVFAGSMLVLWLATLVLGGTLTMSEFATLGFVLSTIFDPLRKLSDVYVRIMRSTAGSERIFAVLDTPMEAEDAQGAVELKPLQKAIDFMEVSFTYPGAPGPALDDVSLTIKRGETVAIVGPNGSGKTTLASLLPRLFDPARGAVLYDGVDVRRAKLSALRRQIGWVSQDAVVFAGTPLANIAYGDAVPDRGRAVNAAKRAYADEFIQDLPGGYDGAIGERGTTLSGGQRQRLAIARAIYRDPPILIFDEATSQIDSESEQKIQRALRELAANRTVIIIAHRLSTIQFAGRIIVMDEGRVLDSGTHRELFDRCPLYQSLCETQFVAEPA